MYVYIDPRYVNIEKKRVVGEFNNESDKIDTHPNTIPVKIPDDVWDKFINNIGKMILKVYVDFPDEDLETIQADPSTYIKNHLDLVRVTVQCEKGARAAGECDDSMEIK